jgi:hypothetical protein
MAVVDREVWCIVRCPSFWDISNMLQLPFLPEQVDVDAPGGGDELPNQAGG